MSFDTPIRINELAKELNLSSKEIIEKLAQLSITGKTHSSTITPDQIKRLKEFISQGSQLVAKKPKAFVVKKAKPVEVIESVEPEEVEEVKEVKPAPVAEMPKVEVVKPRPVANRLEIVRRAPRPEAGDVTERRPVRPQQGERKFPPRDGNREFNKDRDGKFPPRQDRGERPARPFDKRSAQTKEERPVNKDFGDKKPIERRIIPQEMYENKSGTRKEDLLLNPKEYETVFALRKALNSLPVADVTEQIISQMTQTENNGEFLDKIDTFLKKFK